MMPQFLCKNVFSKSNVRCCNGTNQNDEQHCVETGIRSTITESSLLSTKTSREEIDQHSYFFFDDEIGICRSKSIAIPKKEEKIKSIFGSSEPNSNYCIGSYQDEDEQTVDYRPADLNEIYDLATWRMYNTIMDYRTKNQFVSSSTISNQSEELGSDSGQVDSCNFVNQDKVVDEMSSPVCVIRQCYVELHNDIGKESDPIFQESYFPDDEVFDLDL